MEGELGSGAAGRRGGKEMYGEGGSRWGGLDWRVRAGEEMRGEGGSKGAGWKGREGARRGLEVEGGSRGGGACLEAV